MVLLDNLTNQKHVFTTTMDMATKFESVVTYYERSQP